MAAAERHQVWLVTSDRHAGAVRAALDEHRPEGLEAVLFLEEEVGPIQDLPVPGRAHVRYWRWQRAARGVFARLHDEHRFDLGHHLTWAVDWQPAALGSVPGLPFVWGPVGGTTPTCLRLARWLGVRGLLADLAREVVTRPARRLFGDQMAAAATLVLAQNSDVARRFARHGHVEVAPNVAIRLPELGGARPDSSATGGRRAFFVGRVEAWKGLRLAVAAVAKTPEWRLDVFGAGPDLEPTRRLAGRLGVADRVTFWGRRPRAEVVAALARADALLFPSLHDSASFAVGEAVSLGVPVLCLDRGGPPELARIPIAGVAVPADRHAPAALAAALERLPVVEAVDWWSADRLPDEIDRHYRRAVAPVP